MSKVIVAVKSLSRVFMTQWTIACQAPLAFTISRSVLKLMSIESVIPSKHLVLCHSLLLLSPIFLIFRVFSNELALHIRLEFQPQHQFLQWKLRIDFL